MNMKSQHKEITVLVAGFLTLISGLVLTFIGIYSPPVGEISGSVLTALGECLSFAGAALGINAYVAVKIHEIDKEIEKKKDEL